MGRYLTEKEKHLEMASWNRLKETGEYVGVGTPDPEVFSLVDQLNRIPGVLVIQSCAGHKKPDLKADGAEIVSGILWIRLSSLMARRFYERAFELSRASTIEDVSIMFRLPNREVVTIVFRGMGTNQLESSEKAILGFFRSLLLLRELPSPMENE